VHHSNRVQLRLISVGIDNAASGEGVQNECRAQGAVVGTSNGAVQCGYKAVVPVDGMSAEDPYNEQYAAWHLYKGGPINLTDNVTLTRSDLIRFSN
jgi:hypothetical protein